MHVDHALVALAMDGSLNSSLRMVWPRVWTAASEEFPWLPVKFSTMVLHWPVAVCAASLRSLGADAPGPKPKPSCAAWEAPTYPNAPKAVVPLKVSPTCSFPRRLPSLGSPASVRQAAPGGEAASLGASPSPAASPSSA